MPTIQDIIDQIEQAAPRQWQQEWDNAGVQVGRDPDRECTGVLVTLDVTEDSVKEAAQMGANLIVSHHPLIFRGLKTITDATPNERIVTEAIRGDVVIYAAHTNIDAAPGGVNERLAEMLGLKNTEPLVPAEIYGEGVGTGCIGDLDKAIDTEEFIRKIRQVIGTPCLRHSVAATEVVRRIALCGGNGTEFIPVALRKGADLYLTGDLKYHHFMDGDGRMTLVDGGHYETEVQILDVFSALISKKIANFAVRRQKKISNPVHYYTENR